MSAYLLHVLFFGSAHEELMIKPAPGVTTGPEYNKLEGDRNEKRWDAYKKKKKKEGGEWGNK